MEIAKVFTNGGSQAIRLPKTCRFDQDEVLVNKIGNAVILVPKNDQWATLLLGLSMFTEDYLKTDIPDLPLQERDIL